MRADDRIRLRHMLDAAREACRFIQGRFRDSRVEIADLPWEDIIGMRHRLVHAYFDINLDILWKTIQEDLPPFIATLEAYEPGEET